MNIDDSLCLPDATLYGRWQASTCRFLLQETGAYCLKHGQNRAGCPQPSCLLIAAVPSLHIQAPLRTLFAGLPITHSPAENRPKPIGKSVRMPAWPSASSMASFSKRNSGRAFLEVAKRHRESAIPRRYPVKDAGSSIRNKFSHRLSAQNLLPSRTLCCASKSGSEIVPTACDLQWVAELSL